MVIKLNGTQGKKQKFPLILAIYVVLCCTTLPGNLCHGTMLWYKKIISKLYLVPGIYVGSLTHRWTPNIVGPISVWVTQHICGVHHILTPYFGLEKSNDIFLSFLLLLLFFGGRNSIFFAIWGNINCSFGKDF